MRLNQTRTLGIIGLSVFICVLTPTGCTRKSDDTSGSTTTPATYRNSNGRLTAKMIPDPKDSAGELMCAPLHLAVASLDVAEVRRLTAADFDPNQFDSVGKSPLMWLIGRINRCTGATGLSGGFPS